MALTNPMISSGSPCKAAELYFSPFFGRGQESEGLPHLNIIAHMKQAGNPLNRVALGVGRLKFLIEWNVPEMALLLSTEY